MRTVFQIQFDKQRGIWIARVEGKPVDFDARKEALVQRTANQCRCLRMERIDSQIVIHGRDGRIQSERTYGNDPKRRKG